MSIINLIQVSHDYGNRLLFENINLTLDYNTRAGFVGRNGTGKTTLFKIIQGDIVPYAGSVHRARDYKIGYFAQDFHFSSSLRLWDWLYQSRNDLIDKKKELNEVEARFALSAESSHDEKLLAKLHTLQTEYELLGGFGYENEIKSLLLTFGFTQRDYERPIDDFSGGEKTRIRLINILLNKYDFILFDEPTNHLDIITVDWFIQYLKSLNCGYLIISHDRYLLDQVTNRIYELKNKKINTYNGNFSAYLAQSAEREAVLQKQYTQQQKLIEKTEAFIAKNMAGQKTNQAKSRLKMLNRMDKIALDAKDKHIKLKISSSHRSGNDIYRLKNLAIGYAGARCSVFGCRFSGDNPNPENRKPKTENRYSQILAQDINLSLHYRDKVCLIGANGSGKTTLLKVLTGELEPLSGELWTGYSLSIGYYDQLHIDLDNNLTVLETIWSLAPGETYGFVMTYLARFGFYEDIVEQKVRDLSGGEKSRLYLAQLIFEKPNLLILDEPTNHLDIAMIQSLEEALKNYDGTIILVSHDRYFIQAITKDYWVIKDKTIQHYNDSFENLLEKISPYNKTSDLRPQTSEDSKHCSTKTKPKKTNPIILDKLHKEIEALENKIKLTQEEMHNIQSRFAHPDFYTKQSNIDEANRRLSTIKTELETLTLRKDTLETEYLTLSDSTG